MSQYSNWNLVYILPNLTTSAKFGNETIAIINDHDPMINLLVNADEVKELASKFFSHFSSKLSTSLLIINDSKANKKIIEDGVVAFRNILAISSIIKGFEHRFLSTFNAYPLYSDYFDFYPVTISNGVVFINSPSQRGICHDLSNFQGQANATLDHNVSINPGQYCLLTDRLEQVWKRAFTTNKTIGDYPRRLFRSLEMAYHACAIPNKNDETLYDHGVSASLWVSSFEILAHDGNWSSNKKVLELIGGYEWFSKKKIANKSYKSKFDFKINIVQKLYLQLYDLRNDFIHGNKISKSKIFPFRKRENKSIIYYAPLIYKIALLSYMQNESLKLPDDDEFSNWWIMSDAESKIKEIFLSINK